MTNEASEREAFEAWLRREYPLSWALMTAHETALMRDAWKRARAAAPAVQAPPDGWKLVPVEPAAEMQAAGAEVVSSRFDTSLLNSLWIGNKVYRAMIAAAPTAAQPNTDGVPGLDGGQKP
jgi:hypothetical protein